jgi:hypothetical protein
MDRMTTGQIARLALVGVATACIVLWVVGIIIAGVNYAEAFAAARATTAEATVSEDLFGLPLFEGGRRLGRFDIRPGWGLPVLLIAPAVIGIGLSFIAAARQGSRAEGARRR